MKYISNLIIVVFCLFTAVTPIYGWDLQEKGIPYLKNYTPADYGHKGKIWDIKSAPNGLTYMAADKGLLEFDGEEWTHKKGSEGITRSVLVKNDSVIYTGSDRDFGVWKRNAFSDFEYTSLYPFKEDLSEVSEEFWDLFQLDARIYFISRKNVYVFDNENLTKIPFSTTINSSFVVDEQLYLLDATNTLFTFSELAPQRLTKLNIAQKVEIAGGYVHDGGIMLVTNNQGMILFKDGSARVVNNDLSYLLKSASVFSFEKIDEEFYAFGTILKGLFISDRSGTILHYLNKNKGLQNNTILSLHYSNGGNLWMGMDYGLSYIDLQDQYGYFYDYQGDFGTGYTAALSNQKFYLGTNQGLYITNWSALNNSTTLNQFELIGQTEGQVWTLNSVNNELLMGHDQGLFMVRNNTVRRINGYSGVWDIVPFREYLLTGTYNGISIYKMENGEWKYDRQMELILGSCNQIIQTAENVLWINIPNFGVIRAVLDENLIPVEREIFRSETFGGNDHRINRDQNTIVVISEGKSFRYELDSNSFSQETVRRAGRRISSVMMPHIMPLTLNSYYEFYPLYNGFALRKLSRNVSDSSSNIELLLRDPVAFNNIREMRITDGMEVPYSLNNIRFRLIVPDLYEAEYQYRKKGEETWSEWSDENSISIINLKDGSQAIEARALVDGRIITSKKFEFTVRTPWYKTWYAVLAYIIVLASIAYLVSFWRNRSLSEQKKVLVRDKEDTLKVQEERHQEEMRKAEEEQLQERFEQLKARLKSKTIELANKAKENDEKNKVLVELKNKFRKLEERPELLKSTLRSIEQTLDSYLNLGDNTFEIQIDELHQEFFEKLREHFPELTLYDMRLCVYLKLGMDTKEISNLLNIKPSSVYISRSRLRKKLNMKDDQDLHAYLNNL